MFSANENIALRQHKRRIIQHVEECIPPEVLDMGTTVMVMQAACRAPGCVPLETLVLVVFPTTGDKELLPGLKESANGGTYKTKVLKPMADVTRQDVLEALPPAFPGGLRSTEKLCFQARDVMLAQITQLMGEDDLEGRQLMAEYLQECLQEYMKRGCVAPEYGEPFPDDNDKKESATTTTKQPTNGGNFVFRHVPEDEDERALPPMASVASTDGTSTNGNNGSTAASLPPSKTPSTMDWRRQQDVNKAFQSQNIIAKLSEREHAPGVRMVGCPCCDPENPSNYVDSMMML